MFRYLLASVIAAFLIPLAGAPALAQISPQNGQFTVDGKPVEEFHCSPAKPGKYPAVVLLHGAGPKGGGSATFKEMCSDLAQHGYFAEFVEYYSQTSAVNPSQPAEMAKYFPTWLKEIDAGLGELQKNDKVDGSKIALVGFSLGGLLSLSEGELDSGEVTALVSYYGAVTPQLKAMASQMPPTLILQGDADTLVPVSQARDLDAMLSENHRPHEMHIYPGVEHAFNFPGLVTWYNAAAAKDAWERTLKFLDKNLKGS